MDGFIDIHTHILPGVDDGAQTVEDALAMLQGAWDKGTRALLLTPHYRSRYKKNTPQQLREQYEKLCAVVQEKMPGLRLYLGQEVAYEVEAPEALADGKILSMNGSHYVLLEFRPEVLRSRVISGVSETILCGFTPIIAHAERYEIFRKDKNLLDEVLEMGALIQLNADSVMGKQGFSVKRCCHRMLKQQKAHFVASDAHDITDRPASLQACFLRVYKKYGKEYAQQLFYENAAAVIDSILI